MNSSAFSFYSSAFGFVAVGISLAGLVFGLCRSQLPSSKIKVLEELLDDTQCLLNSCVEEGYLPQERVRDEIEPDLARCLRDEIFDLRSQAYKATSFLQDYAGLFAGLSLTIGRACSQVRRLRADVITKSDTERRRRRDNAVLSEELPFHERGPPRGSDALSQQLVRSVAVILNPREANLDVNPFVDPTKDIRPGEMASRRDSADNSYRPCTSEPGHELAGHTGQHTRLGQPPSTLGTAHSSSRQSHLTLNREAEVGTYHSVDFQI
ncbi:hypothetical protein BU15DRAFT_62332 [Melanogaster broomeanus]|nr:hypothetical protein BU15DRAFT_62332 [Melanogaster broomeanus]